MSWADQNVWFFVAGIMVAWLIVVIREWRNKPKCHYCKREMNP